MGVCGSSDQESDSMDRATTEPAELRSSTSLVSSLNEEELRMVLLRVGPGLVLSDFVPGGRKTRLVRTSEARRRRYVRPCLAGRADVPQRRFECFPACQQPCRGACFVCCWFEDVR